MNLDRWPRTRKMWREIFSRWVVSGGWEAAQWIEQESARSLESRVGAGVGLALYFFSLWQAGPGRLFGLEGLDHVPLPENMFLLQRALFQGIMLAFHVMLGVFWGAVWRNVWILIGEIWPRADRHRFSKGARVAATALGIFLLHGAFLTRDMFRHPALYQEAFFERGFFFRFQQIFVTDICPVWILAVYKWTACLFLVAACVEIVRRFVRWLMGLSRPVRFGGLVAAVFAAIFAGGVWGVLRLQARLNTGSNVLILMVDSLRSDMLTARRDGKPLAPRIAELAEQSRTFTSCVSPLARNYPALMTFYTGLSPFTHGVRDAFPAPEDLSLGSEGIPVRLKKEGFWTEVLADFGGNFFGRVPEAFDRVRAPDARAGSLFRQRAFKRQVHLLPYVSGFWGRRLFPSLRGLAELSDPMVLAREAESRLSRLRFKDKFFLTVYFSALREPYALSSSLAGDVMHNRYKGPCRYMMPMAAGKRARFSAADQERVRRLYENNVRALDEAVGRVLDALKKDGLADKTIVVLWSPHGEQLFERGLGQGHGNHLRGREVFQAPLIFQDPRHRMPPRIVSDTVRGVDAAPTLLSLLNLAAPLQMEGYPLTERDFGGEADEYFAAYSETGLWSSPFDGGFYQKQRLPYPSLAQMVFFDFWRGGYLRLKTKYADIAMMARHRMVQLGPERLVYAPSREAVRYELYHFEADPDGVTNFAPTPEGAPRAQELRDVFFRALSRENGWRPQNGYWIPEAFLRAEE